MLTAKPPRKIQCQICKQEKSPREMMPAEFVRAPVADIIRKYHPDWSGNGYICLSDLNQFRTKYIAEMIEQEKGELTKLEEDVLRGMREHELTAKNINAEFETLLTFGERLADKVASFGGSWTFIIIFAVFFLFWMAANSLVLLWRPFDPYPFILLNLVLSCMAAIQAPIIMMSQNRQEAKDRMRAEHDYRINLKAELEVRQLSDKLDHLITHQWQRLLEIQQIQIEIMEAVTERK